MGLGASLALGAGRPVSAIRNTGRRKTFKLDTTSGRFGSTSVEVRRCRVLAEARHALVSPHLAPHWGGNQTARVMFEPELETLPTGRLRALQVERLRALVARVKVSRPSGVGDRRSADSTSAPRLARPTRIR